MTPNDVYLHADTAESCLNLVKCSYLNQDLWNNLTERLRQVSTTEVPFVDCTSLVRRLSTSPIPEINALSKMFESKHPTLWKCFSLAEDDSVCMIFIGKFFCSDSEGSAGDTTPEKSGHRQFVLPVILMHCNQSHVMDVDPARPDVPPRMPDSHTHMVLGSNQIPDLGSLTSFSNQLSTIHKSSYLNTLHAALLQNIAVLPQDFQAAVEICSRTVLSIDVTPLIAGLCSHSVTKLMNGSDPVTEHSAPLNTEILCELLTAVLSKKMCSCSVSLKQPSESDDDEIISSKCDLLHSDINQAFSRYLSKLGFSSVPKCPAHFWLNERVAAAASEGGGVELIVAEDAGSGNVNTSKYRYRGQSGSSASTTSAGQVMNDSNILFPLLPLHPIDLFLLLPPNFTLYHPI